MAVTGRKRRRRTRARRTGGYRASFIGCLAVHEPDKARAEILEAVERSRGRLISAATELGIDRRHLQRLCWLLDLWPHVDQIRERWAKGQGDTPVLRLLRRRQPGLTLGAP